MQLEPKSFGFYVLKAFDRKVNVPLLGALPLNKMALATVAVLGIANPGFIFLGAAGELLYLFLKANSPRFQTLIEGERLLATQESWADNINSAVDRLNPESRERYRRLLDQCRLILGISETLDTDSLGNFRDLRARSLNQLLGIFLRLLTSREVIIDNVKHIRQDDLERDIRNLEKRLAETAEDSALRRSLSGTLEIQQKRLENLIRARENLQVIDAELERIEQQIELIREESAVSGRPEMLSMRLDAVTSTMAETSRWMEEHTDFFDSLAGQPTLTQLPDLPELPVEMVLDQPAEAMEDDFDKVAE